MIKRAMRNKKFFKLNETELLLIYYKDTVKFNAPFSIIIGFLKMSISFLDAFSLSFLTGGFLLSIYFYNLRNKNEYYFYYNRGFTNLHLWAGCFIINTVLILLLYVITSNLK